MMWRYWKIFLVAGSVVAAIAAFSHWRWQAGFNEAEGKWQQRWSQRDADDATALAKRQTEARNEEQRRQNEINEIRNSAAQRLAVVQADASTARAAADRLHNSAEILARRLADRERTCQSAPPGAGQAAEPYCWPSCSAALTKERENWQQRLMKQEQEGWPANGHTMR